MTTENKTYAVIRTDDYYGPTITHTMIDAPTDDMAVADAMAKKESMGRVDLAHNQAATSVDVWEVVGEVNPLDWCGMPTMLEDSAIILCREYGIAPEDSNAVMNASIDVLSVAANRIGMCVVSNCSDRGDVVEYYLCKPLEGDD